METIIAVIIIFIGIMYFGIIRDPNNVIRFGIILIVGLALIGISIFGGPEIKETVSDYDISKVNDYTTIIRVDDRRIRTNHSLLCDNIDNIEKIIRLENRTLLGDSLGSNYEFIIKSDGKRYVLTTVTPYEPKTIIRVKKGDNSI